MSRRQLQAADPINAARFLSVAGQRPCHCRTTKKTDERPPSHLRPYVEVRIIAARSSSVEGVGVTGRSMSALGQKQTSPTYSITSSASNCIELGIVGPSVLAVPRLMTNSNLVGCSTGMSPGSRP